MQWNHYSKRGPVLFSSIKGHINQENHRKKNPHFCISKQIQEATPHAKPLLATCGPCPF
uniref:Uncharacterized protein n=1 Tax=Rhizophora mucronata TaxID=61149 RepID=A0A2P2IIA4_RHIMU